MFALLVRSHSVRYSFALDQAGLQAASDALGGDDDASGVSALLSLARLFHGYHLRFTHTVVLAFFSGEEQGLWGSRGYAKHLRELQDEGAKSATNASTPSVRMMLQADMLGYREAGEPMQLARPDKYDTIEAVG